MKTTTLLLTFVVLSFTAVLGQQLPVKTWIKVAPANAGFTVLMPAEPSKEVVALEGHPGLKNYQLTLDTDLAGYVVTYLEYAEEITDPDVMKVMLDSGRDAATGKGKLISEKEIKLGGYPGREWELELSGGFSASFRAYLVKRRLYQTIFVVVPNESDTPELKQRRQEAATKFLDSFTLIGDSALK